MRRVAFALSAVAAVVTGSACELTEVTTTNAEDVIIAEVVLHAGDTLHTALLHRTVTDAGGQSGGGRVPNAAITVRDEETQAHVVYNAASDSLCSVPELDGIRGTCYAAVTARDAIRPGASYTLRVALDDGRVLRGSTRVPGAFSLRVPLQTSEGNVECTIPPDSAFDIVWTSSAGTSVYIVEALMPGLRAALRERGVEASGDDVVELTGLSVSAADTTIAFPSGLGLFDRFDSSMFNILLAIRDGLPPGVDVDMTIAAADRNYVNWVRGGNFNPSGTVRVSSIQGPGAGVFGSVTSRHALLHVRSGAGAEVTAGCQ